MTAGKALGYFARSVGTHDGVKQHGEILNSIAAFAHDLIRARDQRTCAPMSGHRANGLRLGPGCALLLRECILRVRM